MKLYLNIKTLYAFLIIMLLALVSVIAGADPMFVLVMITWINMMFYAHINLKDRSMLFAFLIAFFVFLLGRDFVQQFFGYQKENFAKDVQFHAYLSYLITLITIGIFYRLFSQHRGKSRRKRTEYATQIAKVLLIRKLSQYVYYFSWIFAILSKIIVGSFVSARGFTDYYTDYSEYLSGNIWLYLISKIELMMPAAWCIYLATRPSKKQIKWPLLFYIVYLIFSLGGGQRSTSMLGILFLFVYFVYRQGLNPDEAWITRKMMIFGILAIPCLAVFASVYNIWREGGNLEGVNFFESFVKFFYDQGVTSNVMKRAYMYKDKIPSNQIYTLEFLHSGILARLLGITVYHGNTVDHALLGGSFTHSLGYVVMGNSYLAGRGTGSCYIAELYQDFRYLGVLGGSILYAYLFANIANRNKDEKVFWTALRFMVITQLLWAPRGSFTGFISQNLTPTALATIVFVFGLAHLLTTKKNKTELSLVGMEKV